MIKAILFDWGDTVMRVLGYEGPMASWPRVEAVAGIEQALLVLRERYRLALATNAADSGCELVQAALQRVGLSQYFSVIVTARELGARKPEHEFYEAVLRQVGCRPDEAVMVGDDYQADIGGAHAAGLRTVWFNPGSAACPVSHPVHNGQVRAMAELPVVVREIAD